MPEIQHPKWQHLIDAFAQKNDADQIELLSLLTLERSFAGNVPLDVTVHEISKHLQTPLDILCALDYYLDTAADIRENNEQLDAVFETQGVLRPELTLLRLVSAYLGHLTTTDLAAWPDDDRDSVDGLLREIIRMAAEARPVLVPGQPDCPACT